MRERGTNSLCNPKSCLINRAFFFPEVRFVTLVSDKKIGRFDILTMRIEVSWAGSIFDEGYCTKRAMPLRSCRGGVIACPELCSASPIITGPHHLSPEKEDGALRAEPHRLTSGPKAHVTLCVI